MQQRWAHHGNGWQGRSKGNKAAWTIQTEERLRVRRTGLQAAQHNCASRPSCVAWRSRASRRGGVGLGSGWRGVRTAAAA
eukprot:5189734-Pleurochrysis_carterae.AAC.1